jgi:hypothetical protein
MTKHRHHGFKSTRGGDIIARRRLKDELVLHPSMTGSDCSYRHTENQAEGDDRG